MPRNFFIPFGNWIKYDWCLMAFPPATVPRFGAAFLVAMAVGLLGFFLEGRFSDYSYDTLHSLSGINQAATANSRVVIIYLDLESYLRQHRDPGQPWPREFHAQLLRRLTAAGAQAVVFDIVFGDAGPDPSADQAFAAAMQENGRVFLASEFGASTSVSDDLRNGGRMQKVAPIFPLFEKAAAGSGIASQVIDDDYQVRRYVAGFPSSGQPTLTWATALWLGLPVTKSPGAMGLANRKQVRYYGPPLTIPHISYTQVLEEKGVSDEVFRGKIVFVGGRLPLGLLNQRNDQFRNPFHSSQYKEFFMPGVEVHATEMLNLIQGDGLKPLGKFPGRILLLMVAGVFGGGLIWFRPVPATGIALVGAAIVPMIAKVAFERGTWSVWVVVSAVQIPAALFGSWLWQFQEWFFTRRKLEAAKRIADAKIREQAALIEKAHDAILVQNLQGRIIYLNPGAEKLYGWRLSELTLDAAAQIFSPVVSAVENARISTLANGEWNGELHLQTRSGQTITVDSRWTLIRDDDGEPQALLLISIDVTEKKSLEQQFLRAQRMNTIGTLAGGMAHDLNNALSPVLLGTQLLRRKTSDAGDLKLLSMMENSTYRGAEMVQQVLLFARGRGGEFEHLDLALLVKDLEKMVRETFPKNILIESYLPSDLRPIWGNATQIHQVLLNLCVNARDAMPGGGKLSFVADNVEFSEVEARAIPEAKPGRYVSMMVSDSGTGMSPEVKTRIFEPFFTTKGEGQGTGIGLATVVRILKGHGGFLCVESEVGQGTSFELFIPCAPNEPMAIAKPRETELPRGGGELILLADDELALCELMAEELREFGYRVVTASDGSEAIALFKKHAKEVVVFITDGSMPVISGLMAITTIRELSPKLPVILVSGEPVTERLEGVIELKKPFALAELLLAVNHTLKKPARLLD